MGDRFHHRRAAVTCADVVLNRFDFIEQTERFKIGNDLFSGGVAVESFIFSAVCVMVASSFITRICSRL
jgi:hypothetical protein